MTAPTAKPCFGDIGALAETHWKDFLDASSAKACDLFVRKCLVNPVARGLFKHTAQVVIGAPVADIIICHGLDVHGVSGWIGSAGSWLWQMGPNEPRICIDKQLLVRGLAPTDVARVTTWLILHETGHVAKHWSILAGVTSGSSLGASWWGHEEEAWWFASAIVGLAAGEHARRTRKGPPLGHDPMWQHI